MQFNDIIEPVNINLSDENYKKLSISKEDKAHFSSLFQHIPAMIGSMSLSKVYVLKFPKGVSGTLTKLQQGGYSTALRNNGVFSGTASLFPTTDILLGINILAAGMTILSIITSQYYLHNINQNLTAINEKIDRILDFLYGDKKSELISEYTFINEALLNYSYIIQNEAHRIATLTNIQESRKIAMKDVDFYMNDLYNNAKYKLSEDDILKTKQNVDFALQLYVMSSFMEIYYSMTDDNKYLSNVKDTMFSYVTRIEHETYRELCFLQGKIHGATTSGKIKVPRIPGSFNASSGCSKLDDLVERLSTPNRPDSLSNIVDTMFKDIEKEHRYYITASGNIYTD